MTPEELWNYLILHGFDEDCTQSSICAYLTSKVRIRHPKAWIWTVARHARQRQEIQDRKSHNPELSLALDRCNPDPLRQAIARQELIRTLEAMEADNKDRENTGRVFA